MSIIESLLDVSQQDTQLLIGNDEKGDNFSISRDIDFVLKTNDAKKAEIVCKFINDNNYADASFELLNGEYRILAIVHMPSTQHLVCTLSGLMTCISNLFGVEYDGWGCVLKTS